MSNADTPRTDTPRQAPGEPAVTGAKDSAQGGIAPSAEQASAEVAEVDVEDMTTDELLAASRNAESRMNVFSSLAQTDPQRHGEALNKAKADFAKFADALKEHNYDPTGKIIDPSLVVPDKEGTAPTLADAGGNFADDAWVANQGGIGEDMSNTDPEGAMERAAERAGRDDMTDTPGTSPLMSRKSTIRARRERGEDSAAGERQQRRRERVPLVGREAEPA